VAKWESEFSQLMNNQRDELEQDYGETMQKAWGNGAGDFRDEDFGDSMKFDDEGLPILGDYIFGKSFVKSLLCRSYKSSLEPNNKYLASTSTRSALSEAKALLEQNGSLTEAGLLLEAAIQSGELGEGGYETWILLGETRNMDEREEQGMRALAEGVKRAEAAGAPGAGMLVCI
jgi:peroxin-5